jgi:hypothetical protein
VGQLMLRCPMTDRNFSTGIGTDGKSLKRVPYARIAVRCPYCGLEHTWGLQDATSDLRSLSVEWAPASAQAPMTKDHQ